MIVKAQAQNIRIYNQVELQLKPYLNFFVGNNGHGKTAFLESLFLGLRGKSFRPFSKDAFIKKNTKQASVCLDLKKEGDLRIEVFFKQEVAGPKREVFMNQKKTSFSFIKKNFPLLVFQGEDLNTIKGSSEQRRRFIDQFLIFRNQENDVRRFKNILKEKTSLFYSYRRGRCSFAEAVQMLDALNETFLQASIKLLQQRLSYLNEVRGRVQKISSDFFEEDPLIDFQYFISSDEIKSSEEASLKIKNQLQREGKRELEAGVPLIGPQKHDIVFLFNGKNSRTFCSQGQQKTLLLSLFLLEALGPSKPFLFLDDILAELDDKTQKKILSFIEKTACQAFLTTCKKPAFYSKKTWFFQVKSGTMKRLL